MSEPKQKEWFEWDSENEPYEAVELRRMQKCPILTPVQFEVLKQMIHATWDGYVISKQARSDLIDMGLVTKWNDWQVITRQGLAVLEIVGYLRGQKIRCANMPK